MINLLKDVVKLLWKQWRCKHSVGVYTSFYRGYVAIRCRACRQVMTIKYENK